MTAFPDFEKQFRAIQQEFAAIKDPDRRDNAQASQVFELLQEVDKVYAHRRNLLKEAVELLTELEGDLRDESEEHGGLVKDFEKRFDRVQKAKKHVYTKVKNFKSQEHVKRTTRPGERDMPIRGRSDARGD